MCRRRSTRAVAAFPAGAEERDVRVTFGWPFLLSVLLWVVVTAAALALLEAAWDVLTLLAITVTLAGLLLAPAEALARWMPRVVAVVLVVLAMAIVVGAATANQTWQLERHAATVSAAIAEGIERLDEGSRWRRLLVQGEVAERSQRFLDQLPRTVVFGTADQAESARRGLDVVLVLIITVYATLNGPQVTRNLTGAITCPERRDLVHVALRAGLDRAAAYVRRSLAWGVLSGVAVACLSVVLELPGPSTLALWAGVWSVVPVLGVVVGFAPIVGLAALDDWRQAALVVGAGLVWWALSLVAIARWVAAPTIRLGPLLVSMALAVGLQFGWLVGSLVALFALAWIAGFLAEVGRRTDPGDTPLGELTEDPTEGSDPSLETVALVPSTPRTGARSPALEPDDVLVVWSTLDPRAGARAAGLVVAAVAALSVTGSADPGPTWIVVGIVLGLALDPAARWVSRRLGLPGGAAVAVVVGGSVALLAGIVLIALPSLIESIRRFDEQIVVVADDLEALPVVGDELRRRGVGDELRRGLDDLPDELAENPEPVTDAVRVVGDVTVASFWTFLVALGTLIDGRRIATRARVLVPAPHRRRADEVAGLVYDTVVRYAAGSALLSALVGLGVFATAIALGIPLAPVLAIWALLWTFVPQIGGFVAAVPLVILALVQGTADAVIALALYGLVWQVKNRILMPVVIGRAVNLSPVVAMTAVLLGGAAAGLVGAVLATPLVGTARLLYRHLRPHPAASPVPAATAGITQRPA